MVKISPSRLQWMPLAAFVLVGSQLGCIPEARDPSETSASFCPENSQWDGVRCVSTVVACPDGSAWMDGKCVADLPSKPPAAESDPLIGAFSVAGTPPNGTAGYTGDASISAKGKGGPYVVTWSIAGSSYSGIGARRGDVLTVGWSDGSDHGVVDYVAKGDGNLVGIWFDAHSPNAGKELLTGGLPNLSGVYNIQSAMTPDGGTYGGSCDLGVTGELHMLIWHVGSETYRGLGLRRGDLLGVGFSTAKSGNFGVAQYDIKGNMLVGRWAEWQQKSAQLGTETLTKKP